MGSPYFVLFLEKMTQAWKDRYVHSFTSLSGAFGGSSFALSTLVLPQNQYGAVSSLLEDITATFGESFLRGGFMGKYGKCWIRISFVQLHAIKILPNRGRTTIWWILLIIHGNFRVNNRVLTAILEEQSTHPLQDPSYTSSQTPPSSTKKSSSTPPPTTTPLPNSPHCSATRICLVAARTRSAQSSRCRSWEHPEWRWTVSLARVSQQKPLTPPKASAVHGRPQRRWCLYSRWLFVDGDQEGDGTCLIPALESCRVITWFHFEIFVPSALRDGHHRWTDLSIVDTSVTHTMTDRFSRGAKTRKTPSTFTPYSTWLTAKPFSTHKPSASFWRNWVFNHLNKYDLSLSSRSTIQPNTTRLSFILLYVTKPFWDSWRAFWCFSLFRGGSKLRNQAKKSSKTFLFRDRSDC